MSKTPQLEDIFKSQDQFKYLVTYLYHLKKYPWLGPFGRLNFSTSLFSGYYVSPEDEELVLKFADGTTQNGITLEANERYKIVDSLEPMTIRVNIGVFANPFDKKEPKTKPQAWCWFSKDCCT